MDLNIVIRNETNADVAAITYVTISAFRALEISNHTEQFVISALRAAKALSVSLVAEFKWTNHWAYRFFTYFDLGRNTKLVWIRASICATGISAARNW